MLISGQKVTMPARDVVIFPRVEGQFIFYIVAVPSFEAFDTLCPRPEPPKILKKGKQVEDTDDPTFKQRWQTWVDYRQDWLLLQALADSENDITWESVKPDDPSTWSRVNQELKDAGLTELELQRLIGKVYEVNALSERGMEAARANFLLMTSLEPSDE